MLRQLQKLLTKEELLQGGFGIEREALRVTSGGKLAFTDHPQVFGDKLKNPYITTDFSESQVEMVTPVCKSAKEVYDWTNALYDIVSLNIGEEYLWPQSMPCDIPEDEAIPIAKYTDSYESGQARSYREGLLKRYGGKKQMISGIHLNFSFEEQMLRKLFANQSEQKEYKLYKNGIYLKVVRQYLKYRWLLIMLMGASPIMHESFARHCTKKKEVAGRQAYTRKGAVSFRNGECGYKNNIELYPDYTSVESYIQSIKQFIREDSLQSHKELYSPIRPKAKNNQKLLDSLLEEGIAYIEIRSIDNNPFEKGGISRGDIEFIQIFILYLLIKEEKHSNMWQKEATDNQHLIAKRGLEDPMLSKDGLFVQASKWAMEILHEMLIINQELKLEKEELIHHMIEKILNPKLSYAYQIKEKVKQEGYLNWHLKQARAYREDAYKNRFKLYGYEHMELSTQILMKEAIKKGIEIEVLDDKDNFIALKQGEHVEYVKQATKTSKDSYMTMLIMENKTVTKKILLQKGICVPKGIEIHEGENVEYAVRCFEGKPIVVKPKSTNFGTGISIFPKGGSKEDMIKAVEIGMKYDNTVLLEEFARGKEYRFLVIGDEVAGILHRVPANVVGDGKSSIRKLMEMKNEDPLRGKGYKTPLEYIREDENSTLFLKQKKMSFDSVPKAGEIVYLRENSNISTGGDSIDYTDQIPECFKEIAVEAARAVKAKFCGVDMMLEEAQNPKSNYAIIEINFNPAIHIHSFPYKGVERNIADKVLNVLGFTNHY